MKAKYSHQDFCGGLVHYLTQSMRHLKISKLFIKKLEGSFMRRALLTLILIILTGCDFAYQALSVRENASANIQIIPLTPETVLKANQSSYEPKKWPDIFSSYGKTYMRDSGNSSLNDPILDPQRLSGVIEWRMPDFSQPPPYLIGVGDVIMLSAPIADSLVEALDSILASQNSRHRYTVQDNGTVSIPDIGRVVIGGLTLEEVEDAVYRKFVDVGMAPSFSIEITEFNSQKISVSGNVVTPGIEPISIQPLYLDQAISQRGGIAISDVSFVVIRLYRDGNIYQISGPEIYNQNGTNRILLRDGDKIVVDMTNDYENILGLRQQARAHILQELEMETEAKQNQAASLLSRIEYGSIARDYVYLIGEVQQQSRFTLPFENQAFLADALLTSAGGVSSLSGNPKQIYVLRGAYQSEKLEKIVAFHLDSTNVANFLLATSLELRPKDVVFIGTQPITNWNRIVSQIIPSLGLPNLNIPSIR